MVQFGRHIDVFVEHQNAGTGLFVVPYNDVKATFEDDGAADNELIEQNDAFFVEIWRDNVTQASADFERSVSTFWTTVFEDTMTATAGGGGVADDPVRGALPGVAISLYVQLNGVEAAQEALVRLKQIYEAAQHNTQALRKLVKKYDKKHQCALSRKLLPIVYSANFTLGQPNLEEGIALLRDLLAIASPTNDTTSLNGYPSGDESGYDSDKSNAIVNDRQSELEWLLRLTESMSKSELSGLVAHRGFHSIDDHIHRRPVENSLSAYETAWTHGIHLCECDIALTKDEHLVLAHDETFSRLALNKTSFQSKQKVQDLTFRELLALPLTSASRPPLLLDVLRSADAIGGSAQLVIEIKPGHAAAATALARLFQTHPEFLCRVAVVMSFDAYAVHTLKQELLLLADATVGASASGTTSPAIVGMDAPIPLSHHRRRSSRLSFSSGLLATASSSPSLNALCAPSPPPSASTSLRKRFVSHNDFQIGGGSSLGLPLSASARSLPRVEGGEPPHHMYEQYGSPPTHQPSHPEAEAGAPAVLSPNQMRCGHHPGFPKLMLLTVSDPPKKPCELRVGIDDLSPIDAWLSSADGCLDGVYLQYQPGMLTPDGAAAVRALAQRYSIGIWTYSGIDPDDYTTFVELVRECNVTFCNTDLPEDFHPHVPLSNGHKQRTIGRSSPHRMSSRGSSGYASVSATTTSL